MKKNKVKALLLAGALAVLTGISSAAAETAYAKEVPWLVDFTAGGDMVSDFDSKTVQDSVAHMQPGDETTFIVTIRNSHAQTTRWYMKNEVLDSLEDSTATARARGGAAYTYDLSYSSADTGTALELFKSDTVGGESKASADREGMREATAGLEEYFALDDLATGQKGTVVLHVALDGETQGNAYQDTAADLMMQFAVELPETPTPVPSTTTPTPTPTPGTITPTPTPATSTTTTTTGSTTIVKTGDNSHLLLYGIIAGIAGIVLLCLALISIKKRKTEQENVLPGESGQPDEKEGLK